MIGRPGHWSEPGEYNISFLGSILAQDSTPLGYREFTQERAMTISPFAAGEGTSAPQWPKVKKCCRHLVPSSDFFIQSYAVPRNEGGEEFTQTATLRDSGNSRRLLSGPISRDTAILLLRYPISRDTFQARSAVPQKRVRYPPLVLSFAQAHLCDTPFCNVSRDYCAIPHKNKHERVCDTIATSIARYEKYRCWASKAGFQSQVLVGILRVRIGRFEWCDSKVPDGPRIEKIQSREAILKTSSFQYGMKFSTENVFSFRAPL